MKNTTCPASVHGNKSWIGFGTSYYLYSAVEIMEDDVGNDNGQGMMVGFTRMLTEWLRR